MIPALPTVQSVAQSDDTIYVTGDAKAFEAAHPSATTVIVSPGVSIL